MSQNIPECWYRISIKALVLNETRDKFLIVQEDRGFWELPGGGLDWGVSPQVDLQREVDEEMGLVVTSVAEHPSYFFTFETPNAAGKEYRGWRANILYEATFESLDFKPSSECIAVKFVDKEDLTGLELASNVAKFADMFDPKKHQ